MYDLKEKILQTIPIESYISRFVTLKKQGRYLVGLCPFHKEKTPSFTITPEKGIFYCFGCGKGGNLITFVMEKEKISFQEALKILASFAGLQIQNYSSQKNDKYISLLNYANQIFREFLLSSEGRVYKEYLLMRGVDYSMITKFQIGASPDHYEWLIKHFKEEKENLIQDLYTIGLLKKKDNNQYFDFFRNRIIFPIFDLENNTIGFGGRSIDDNEKPKYLNSPDTSFFHKGSILYGLNFAKKEIQRKNQVIITEGYLDVIGLHQIGIENVVAPLGTGFTEEHKKLLLRFTKNIYILLDGDKAGRNATLRILNLFLEEIDSVRVILLPESLDPFDLSLKIKSMNEKSEIFSSLNEVSISGVEYILFYLILLDKDYENFFSEKGVLELNSKIKQFVNIDSLKNYYESFTLEEKKILLEKIKNFFSNIRNEVFKELLIQEWKKITRIDLKELIPKKEENLEQKLGKKNSTSIDDSEEILFIIERELVGFLLSYPEMLKNLSEELEKFNFYDEYSNLVYRTLYENFIILNNEPKIPEILSFFPIEIQKLFIPYLIKEQEISLRNKKNISELTDSSVKENIFKELITRHRIEEINKIIKTKQNELKITTEGELKNYLYNEVDQLLKEKKNLKSSLRGSV